VGVKGKGHTCSEGCSNLPENSGHEKQTLQDTSECKTEENGVKGDEDINVKTSMMK